MVVNGIILEITPGTRVEQAIAVAYDFFRRERCRVSFAFNGVKITVEEAPGENP